MYTKEETSKIRQEFWTTFGQYISFYRSIDGKKVNWVNYKTGIKHIYFRMQADKKEAIIAISIEHPDLGIQELFYEQFLEFKNLLQSALQEEWKWQLHATNEFSKTISTISISYRPVNIFNRDHWPELISFFKSRLLILDEFWYDVKDSFNALK